MITTRQELVNAVRAGMEAQDWRRGGRANSPGCWYVALTSPDRCGIGVLMPKDADIARGYIGLANASDPERREVLALAGIHWDMLTDAIELQSTHDLAKHDPHNRWKDKFDELVRFWGCT